MKYLIIDSSVQPAIMVHATEDEKDAHSMAERYARTHGVAVWLVESKRTHIVTLSTVEKTGDASQPGGSPK